MYSVDDSHGGDSDNPECVEYFQLRPWICTVPEADPKTFQSYVVDVGMEVCKSLCWNLPVRVKYGITHRTGRESFSFK